MSFAIMKINGSSDAANWRGITLIVGFLIVALPLTSFGGTGYVIETYLLRNPKEISDAATTIKSRGFPAQVVEGKFRKTVQIGPYKSRDEAMEALDGIEALGLGYALTISEVPLPDVAPVGGNIPADQMCLNAVCVGDHVTKLLSIKSDHWQVFSDNLMASYMRPSNPMKWGKSAEGRPIYSPNFTNDAVFKIFQNDGQLNREGISLLSQVQYFCKDMMFTATLDEREEKKPFRTRYLLEIDLDSAGKQVVRVTGMKRDYSDRRQEQVIDALKQKYPTIQKVEHGERPNGVTYYLGDLDGNDPNAAMINAQGSVTLTMYRALESSEPRNNSFKSPSCAARAVQIE